MIDISIEMIIITLISLSLILLIFSFFKRDRLTELEKQVEHLSMQMMQENYQTKKKLKLLEEELIGADEYVFNHRENETEQSSSYDNDIEKQKEILRLLQKGYKK